MKKVSGRGCFAGRFSWVKRIFREGRCFMGGEREIHEVKVLGRIRGIDRRMFLKVRMRHGLEFVGI